MRFYELCLKHPSLKITIVRQTEVKDIWEVSHIGAADREHQSVQA